METYFNINYEFDKEKIHSDIATRLKKPGSDYICVADGVILDNVNRCNEYRKIINSSLFSICDSSYVPLYLKWIYGIDREQYSGSQIFHDIISQRIYRMIFMGASKRILDALKKKLLELNPEVEFMQFIELPFRKVEDFDYPNIAETINKDRSDIIWVALGAPKQEYFMSKLQPHLSHGIMLGVGAAFKFFSGVDANRAPDWMIRNHLEFVYRVFSEPKKQIIRCYGILESLPKLIFQEAKRKRTQHIIN